MLRFPCNWIIPEVQFKARTQSHAGNKIRRAGNINLMQVFRFLGNELGRNMQIGLDVQRRQTPAAPADFYMDYWCSLECIP